MPIDSTFLSVIEKSRKVLKYKIVIIFLFISLNMCFWCSKELSQ